MPSSDNSNGVPSYCWLVSPLVVYSTRATSEPPASVASRVTVTVCFTKPLEAGAAVAVATGFVRSILTVTVRVGDSLPALSKAVASMMLVPASVIGGSWTPAS